MIRQDRTIYRVLWREFEDQLYLLASTYLSIEGGGKGICCNEELAPLNWSFSSPIPIDEAYLIEIAVA